MKRMAEMTQVNALTRDLVERDDGDEKEESAANIPARVEVCEGYGTLFVGAVEQFAESLRIVERKPKVIILETRNLLAIDATGLRALEELSIALSRQGCTLLVSGIHKQPLFAVTQSRFFDQLGEDNFCGSLAGALERAQSLMTQSPGASSTP